MMMTYPRVKVSGSKILPIWNFGERSTLEVEPLTDRPSFPSPMSVDVTPI